MKKYLIRGGIKLDGKIRAESAKNSVLPIMAASILANGQVIIENCPKISDVFTMIDVLNSLGVSAFFTENNLVIDASGISYYTVKSQAAKKIRSSFFMVGALLSKTGKACVCFPGGCDIGSRPVDIHVGGLKSIGVSVYETDEGLICTRKDAVGGEAVLPFPSVGATENIILASVIGSGTTVIKNAAKEPEIVDLCDFLIAMGAKICGAGSEVIRIESVKRLFGTVYKPIPDRIEVGTFLLAAAITGGEIEINNSKAENISLLIHKLCNNTCKIYVKNDIIYLKSGRSRKSFSFVTGPYPEFPTDLQAQTTSLLCVSDGVSVVRENVFENRFNHVAFLNKMGADVKVCGQTAIINGVKGLTGAEVSAKDLRGGAALTIAALCAEGKSEIRGVEFIERGYSLFDIKLKSLGADIKVK